MTKLSNSLEYFNPHFAAPLAEYLLSSGFTLTQTKDTLFFATDKKQLVIRNDNVDMFNYIPEIEGAETNKWIFDQAHTGIRHLELFDWILLLHATKAVLIQDFIGHSKTLNPQRETEATFIIKTLCSQLKAAS